VLLVDLREPLLLLNSLNCGKALQLLLLALLCCKLSTALVLGSWELDSNCCTTNE
jgi:hypothetical protein